MSLNRKTKSYRLRVKALARAFNYPSLVGVFGGVDKADAFERVLAVKEPNAPAYLVEDALHLLIHDAGRQIRYAEMEVREACQAREMWSAILRSKQRPRFSVVQGGAA